MDKVERVTIPALRLMLATHLVRSVGEKQSLAKTGGIGLLLLILSEVHGGPRHSFLNRLLGTSFGEKAHVNGFVTPGFERVYRAFMENVKDGLELGAQFVVYYRGEKVVDLYGGTLPDSKYNERTVQVCFSSSKVVAAIVIAMAVDKGRLDYNERVATYWPEFAQNGKEDITLADVLRHDSGLPFFDKEKLPVHLAGRDRMDEMAEFFAKQPPVWKTMDGIEPKGRCYHGLTRGFILNELLRRTDPKGRSMGEFIKEEIAIPFGLDISLGKNWIDEDRSHEVDLEFDPFHRTLLRSLWDHITGKVKSDESRRVAAFLRPGTPVNKFMNSMSYENVPFTPHDYFNHPEFKAKEVASANMVSNARSLAKLADMMARKTLLSPQTYEAAHSEVTRKYDHCVCLKTSFNKGGWNVFEGSNWEPFVQGFVGWGGFGGSMMAWNQDKELAISYTMNGPQFYSIFGFRDQRCLNLMRALMKSVDSSSSSL